MTMERSAAKWNHTMTTMYKPSCKEWVENREMAQFNPLLCASRKSNKYTALCIRLHFNLYGICLGSLGSSRRMSIYIAIGSTAAKKHACRPSRTPSVPLLRNERVIKRWLHVINVIRPSVKNELNVLQHWVNLLSSWMTLKWSHFLDLTVSVKTKWKSYLIRLFHRYVFPIIKNPLGKLFIVQWNDPPDSWIFGWMSYVHLLFALNLTQIWLMDTSHKEWILILDLLSESRKELLEAFSQ